MLVQYWGVKNPSHFVSTWVTKLKAKNDEKGLLMVITSSLAQKSGKKARIAMTKWTIST